MLQIDVVLYLLGNLATLVEIYERYKLNLPHSLILVILFGWISSSMDFISCGRPVWEIKGVFVIYSFTKHFSSKRPG